MAKLNEKQIAAITYLSLPKRGGFSYGEIADKVGVDERTLRRWRNDDKFNEELKRQIVRNTIDDLPDIMASIPEHIKKDGNAAMFRTLLQSHGMLTDKVEVENKSTNETVSVDDMKAKIEQYRNAKKEE